MNKKILIALAAVAVIAVAVLMRVSPPKIGGEPFTAPEMAFPKVGDGDHYVLFKLENPELMRNKLDAMAKMLPALADKKFSSALDSFEQLGRSLSALTSDDIDTTELDSMRSALDGLDAAKKYLDMAKQGAVLIVSGDSHNAAQKSELHLSFFPDAEKFDAYIASAANLKKWETSKAGPKGGAWTIGDGVYMLRTGDGDDVVLISDAESGIDRMLEAMKKPASRMEIKRFNQGPDYVQARVPIPVRDTGEVKTGFAELAWVEDDRSAHLQIHTDIYSVMTGRAVPKSGLEGKDLPLLGRGDLAFVGAVDLPYACFAAFPLEEDPVGKVLSLFGDELPAMYMNDIKAIVEQSRASAVVVADPATGEPNTAYLVLETKAKSAVDRYYGLAGFFMQPATLSGWDSALALSIGGLGVDPILARRGDIVLMGIGKPADYAVEATVPKDIADFAAPHDLLNFVATSALLDASDSSLGQKLQEELLGEGIPPSVIETLGIDKLEAVQFRMMTPEKANLGLYWDRSGN